MDIVHHNNSNMIGELRATNHSKNTGNR